MVVAGGGVAYASGMKPGGGASAVGGIWVFTHSAAGCACANIARCCCVAANTVHKADMLAVIADMVSWMDCAFALFASYRSVKIGLKIGAD